MLCASWRARQRIRPPHFSYWFNKCHREPLPLWGVSHTVALDDIVLHYPEHTHTHNVVSSESVLHTPAFLLLKTVPNRQQQQSLQQSKTTTPSYLRKLLLYILYITFDLYYKLEVYEAVVLACVTQSLSTVFSQLQLNCRCSNVLWLISHVKLHIAENADWTQLNNWIYKFCICDSTLKIPFSRRT